MYAGSILLVCFLCWGFFGSGPPHQDCQGTIVMNHDLKSTSSHTLGDVTVTNATMDSCLHADFRYLKVNPEKVRFETRVLDGGVVTYTGPSSDTIAELARHTIWLQLAFELVIFSGFVCIFLGKTFWMVWVVAGVILLAIVMTSQPNYGAMRQLEEATEQRLQGIQLNTCLTLSLFPKLHSHWFSQAECLCVWHQVALGEVLHPEVNWDSMQEFHQKSMLSKRRLDHILLQRPTGPNLLAIHSIHHKILSWHNQLEDIVDDVQDEIEREKEKIAEAKADIAAVHGMVWTVPWMAVENNASLPTLLMVNGAANYFADKTVQAERDKIHACETRIKKLKKKHSKLEREQQYPLLEKFFADMRGFRTFLRFCTF
jgi:hypothetical protein